MTVFFRPSVAILIGSWISHTQSGQAGGQSLGESPLLGRTIANEEWPLLLHRKVRPNHTAREIGAGSNPQRNNPPLIAAQPQ
jgi:hypothetical protein